MPLTESVCSSKNSNNDTGTVKHGPFVYALIPPYLNMFSVIKVNIIGLPFAFGNINFTNRLYWECNINGTFPIQTIRGVVYTYNL